MSCVQWTLSATKHLKGARDLHTHDTPMPFACRRSCQPSLTGSAAIISHFAQLIAGIGSRVAKEWAALSKLASECEHDLSCDDACFLRLRACGIKLSSILAAVARPRTLCTVCTGFGIRLLIHLRVDCQIGDWNAYA